MLAIALSCARAARPGLATIGLVFSGISALQATPDAGTRVAAAATRALPVTIGTSFALATVRNQATTAARKETAGPMGTPGPTVRGGSVSGAARPSRPSTKTA